MNESVKSALQTALDDWSMMQKTSGDEGAEWAERFERHFYEFVDVFKKWFISLEPKPSSLEDAEKLEDVKQIQELLPGPLQLNFTIELEEIIDGIKTTRFD
ncbi:hypothetical protein [Bacillus sp. FJAT-45350]|uniref:hypothetical protein n=1 Tax=Bacillus sp. FJAT-45350 TaxID=2011014 RepID=UPI000BB893F1|nr:hypothetical protein [Bacillus sp. FJAT-45350]